MSAGDARSGRELRTTYLSTVISPSRENKGGNDVDANADANDDNDDDDEYKDWLSRCANTNLRTRTSLGVIPGQRVLSAAIYIGAAMPRSPVRRETVSFLEKQITGVDQRRGDDLPFGLGLAKERHKNRSVRFSQHCKVHLTLSVSTYKYKYLEQSVPECRYALL